MPARAPSNGTLVVSIAAAAIAAGAVYLTAPAVGPAGHAEAEVGFTLTLDPASVSSVSIHAGAATAVLQRSADRGWVLTLPALPAPTTWPADSDAVRALLGHLATLEFLPRDGTGERPDTAEPLPRIEIQSAGRNTALEVLSPPLAGRIAMRVLTAEGPREATLPADRLRPASPEDLAALAEPRPLDIRGVPTSLDIATGDGTTAIALRREAGLWTLAGSPARVDQAAVAALLESLAAVRVAGVVVPYEPPTGPPALTVSLRADLPRAPGQPSRSASATLRVGGQANIRGDAAATAERTSVLETGEPRTDKLSFTIAAQAFPALPAAPDALLDPVPLPWPAGETGRITLRSAAASGADPRAVTYTRTLEGWVREPAGPTDRAALEQVIAALASPSPAALDPDPPRQGPPDVSIEVAPIGSGEPAEFAFAAGDDRPRLSEQGVTWTLQDGPLADALSRLLPAP